MYIILCVTIISFVAMCVILTKRYRNPYKLIMVFGKKGSGKTTLLTKLAIKELKKGKTVYSTVDVPGCITFNVNHIGNFVFPPGSVIFIDEVGMIWDNRNFKNFRTEVRDYFKLQRHYRNKVYLFSQTFDIDLKLRNLTDSMWLCTCKMGWLSIARKISRKIVVVEANGESESRIADNLEFVPVFFALFGMEAIKVTFIPRWAKYFDSHEVPKKPYVKGKLRPPYVRKSRRKLSAHSSSVGE